MRPRLSYIICTSPRSGSWLLADGLESTGVAGNPKEWFSIEETGDNEENLAKRWGISLAPPATYEPYIGKVLEEGTTGNGIFGMKCMSGQFAVLPEKLKTIAGYSNLPVPERMARAFPNLHYIRLIRRDKIRQAISYYRARQTDVWHIESGLPAEHALEPTYDFEKIAGLENTFVTQDRNWEEYLGSCQRPLFILTYEELSKDYENSIRRVLAYLHLKEASHLTIQPPRYKKLADASVDKWMPLYMEYKRNHAGIFMDKSWLAWTEENLRRGCNPEEILGILLKNNFAPAVIRQAMGDQFPAHSALLQAHAPRQLPPPAPAGVDYKSLCEIPLLRLGRMKGAGYVANPKMQLFTIDHFLAPEECDRLIEIINPNLRPSTVTVYAEGFRTSATCDLCLLPDPFVAEIDRKIAAALGIRLPYSEGIQAQKYEAGEEFKPHTDYFEPGTKEYADHAAQKGNRTWTLMVYLNDTLKGGGTRFVNLNRTFYPKKGMAVAWNNLYADGRPNPDTRHWGMPVEEGAKIIITKWFREKGPGPMFEGI
ncbi:MAG: 2OG-Fe(II) oxygenase [Pseudomonadota bacterium]|nr:2OG-Fe(II) oxygenase [Pseudomonadota bacterium]MDE3037426.1 2OG-Fe(II) oxygenase [Pseudomonadota bacterium]